MVTKAKKGTVSLYTQDGMLRVSFRINGKRYRFALGLPDKKPHRLKAVEIAAQIELDILSGYFDATLTKYQPNKPLSVRPDPKPVEPDKSPSKTRKKPIKKRTAARLPLSAEEIERLLLAIRSNEFCPKKSAFKHSHYADFLETMFLLGTRNAELIGLQVKHCNFQAGTIEISSTLARAKNSSNSNVRVRKDTKTGNIRFLPMSDRVRGILLRNCQGRKPTTLVFRSPKGGAIDDRMLQRRVLKPVLAALGIADRDLYAARHSFGTRALEQGIPLNQVAALMGHSNTETTIKNYIHNKMPDKLPDL